MRARRSLVLGCAGLIGAIAVWATPSRAAAPSKADAAKQIRFGTEMARQGNWHEAIFRWRRALLIDPDNPRLHNNIAVGYESLGQYDKAAEEYRTAVALPGAPEEIARNRDLFEKFYARYREAAPAQPEAAPAPRVPAPGHPEAPAVSPEAPPPAPPAAPPPAPGTPPPPAGSGSPGSSSGSGSPAPPSTSASSPSSAPQPPASSPGGKAKEPDAKAR